jgi:acetoin utilization deacetylase AcuC-like enzyme/ankyrin repeat protein
MEALLSGDFDDDDDDDDDASFQEGNEGEEADDDDDDDEGLGAPTTRLPLHTLASCGKVEELTAALEEGKTTGQVTVGKLPDGTPRKVHFDLNQTNDATETPLHATILAAAEALAIAVAPSDDPWVRAAAKEDARLLKGSVASPLASDTSPVADVDADTEGRLACLKLLIDAGVEMERKVYGRSALHLACACAALPSLSTLSSRVVELLLAGGASPSQVDACGKTPLHYAAVGCAGANLLDILLASPSASEAVLLADKSGATALHDALRAGKVCAANAQKLIAKGGASLATAADVEGFTPLHLAAASGLEHEGKLLLALGADADAKDAIGRTPTDVAGAVDPGSALSRSYASRPQLLLAHPASLLHNAPAGEEAETFEGNLEQMHFGQPECAARLRSLLSPAGHLRGQRYSNLVWKAAPMALITDVLRCHEYAYLERVKGLCRGLKKQAEKGGGDEAPAEPLKASVDCDTEVTQHSYSAAMRGAGAVVEACRAVCCGAREARTAFCAVRPPGHHAGPSGAVGGQSAGFCILANAAIGAAYALAVHRDVVKTVAIVDFDIHHGNGTEACVKAVVPSQWTETHETPTGSITASGVTYKPWLGLSDKEKIFFGSIHGYGADGPVSYDEEDPEPVSAFYPGSGGPNDTSTDTKKGPVVRNVPVRLRTRSAAWRREMMTKILIPLHAFNPDLIIISAGFDAHAHDALEAGGLHDRDYEWMTSELVRIAEDCSQGRVVSVLEGGYQVAGGFVSSLARAVGSHVSALNQPSLVGATWQAGVASGRLEAAIAYEESWLTNRAVAQAKATAATGDATDVSLEQDNGAPARRSKRSRGSVDYGALEVEMMQEEQESKKPKEEPAE